ncbi:hypothetical protein NM208_g2056 [Fusarium decemcellulare]|uniref:Uncharacterized protein n=1 Tax=Fusarium decemcellulare TaxID=57161 RepID=A0ACC1STY7_9HYPO|nr:hypothetical protein NM208_g2056 [Fusarium decemcellulare]
MASSDLLTAMEPFYNGIQEPLNPGDSAILDNLQSYSSRLKPHQTVQEAEVNSRWGNREQVRDKYGGKKKSKAFGGEA